MKYLYRMTHIDNMPHILKHGITHKSSNNANPNYVAIGNTSIIDKRGNICVNTSNGNMVRIGDYIPFYFYARMPMLYNIQHGYGVKQVDADDIVYLIVDFNKIVNDTQRDFLFSDAHAISKIANIYDKNDIDKIDSILDIDAIKSTMWADDSEKKERKQAEFLVKGDIPIDFVSYICCHSEKIRIRLIDMGAKMNIIVSPDIAYY